MSFSLFVEDLQNRSVNTQHRQTASAGKARMIIELRDLEHPKESLREVLLSFAAALRENIDKLPQDASARIHDIRVSVKKIRSLLRLAGSTIPDGDRSALVPLLREIKDIFLRARDEEVMQLCLEQLMPEVEAAEAIGRLRLIMAESAKLPDTARALELAREVLPRLAALDFKTLTSSDHVKNAARFFRKAYKLRQRCERAPHDDDIVHRWRIRVKGILSRYCIVIVETREEAESPAQHAGGLPRGVPRSCRPRDPFQRQDRNRGPCANSQAQSKEALLQKGPQGVSAKSV
jgi:hypothetical protein